MNEKEKLHGDLIETYEKKILNHRVLIVALVVVILFLSSFVFRSKTEKLPDLTLEEPVGVRQNIQPPHYEQVMSVIGQLSYSGLQTLVKPSVNVSIDFEQQLWKLTNIHQFDSEGHVLLEEGRYGLCGQLSDYVYRTIKPIFGDQYSFLFSRVAEVGYFLNPRSSHIVIQIKNKAKPNEIFVIDPSLAKYGSIEGFENYIFYETKDHLQILRDPVFAVPSSTPVLIKNKFIVDLGVEGADEKFDRSNFTIALAATKQYSFTGRYIFALRLKEGKVQTFENLALADWVLESKNYSKLKRKIVKWFTSGDLIPHTAENEEIIQRILESTRSPKTE